MRAGHAELSSERPPGSLLAELSGNFFSFKQLSLLQISYGYTKFYAKRAPRAYAIGEFITFYKIIKNVRVKNEIKTDCQ